MTSKEIYILFNQVNTFFEGIDLSPIDTALLSIFYAEETPLSCTYITMVYGVPRETARRRVKVLHSRKYLIYIPNKHCLLYQISPTARKLCEKALLHKV